MTIFGANQIKFDEDYLNQLTSTSGSGVFKKPCKYHLALHPAQFNDFGQSIKDELGRKIARYDELFQGIMLGFTDIKLESRLGAIGVDNCYVHLDVMANFFVFRPEIDMILKGIVTRTTKDHVGCLAYNTFNISLPKSNEDDESWLGNNVSIGSEVEFKITYVDLHARLPHIKGELRSIISEGMSPNKIKNPRKIIFDEVEDTEVKEEPAENPKKKKNKKKRQSVVEESVLHTEIDLEDLKEEPKLEIAAIKHSKKKAQRESLSDNVTEVKEEFEESTKKEKKQEEKTVCCRRKYPTH